MNPVLESALSYVHHNYKVFPLRVNTKNGHVLASWIKEASTDPSQIYEWFSNGPMNIGVCTGNGLAVIDIDNKNGKSGNDSIQSFVSSFPKTKVVSTPNGGFHMYYHVNREIHCTTNLLPGIDIRGEGGYVLGVGSVINNKFYKDMYPNRHIAEANDAVYKFLQFREKKNANSNSLNCKKMIGEGERNDFLFRLGCSLQGKGLSDSLIHDALIQENENHCVPPLGNKEVESIISSVLKYPKNEIMIENIPKVSFTVSELFKTTNEEQPFIVEDILPIGLALLGAPQKTGKTFLCLQLADCITSGKPFLNKKTLQGSALYLAFEDKQNNLKERLKTMKVESKDNFIIDILSPEKLFNLDERIHKQMIFNPDLRLVVVDTFAKIRNSKERDYDSEYEESTYYHELAYKYGIVIVLVTHVRKELDENHPFDGIYGSRGLTAGADTIMVMYKKKYLNKERYLAFQGKEIADGEFTILLNDDHVFEKTEKEFDEIIDENISKVINFIIRVKTFEGSHESLCSKLLLNLTGRQLQALLERNKEVLESSFIRYERLKRNRKARPIKLEYFGDDDLSV